MQLKRIMVPLDGSHLAEAVMPIAVSLAECLGARLTLLHIIEERPPAKVHGEPHLASEKEACDYLEGLARRYGDRAEIEQHVHTVGESNVAQSIADHAGELQADMIALCTHGGSGFRRMVWGSIAQLVLKRVGVPVLIVRPGVPMTGHVASVLVPLDATPNAEGALDLATTFAESCGAAIHLMNVVPTVETVTGDRLAAARLTPISTAEALKVEETYAQDYLSRMMSTLQARGLNVDATVFRGEVGPSIARAVQQFEADIVIIATHGRAGLDAMYTGSVGQTIMARATRPILLVKI